MMGKHVYRLPYVWIKCVWKPEQGGGPGIPLMPAYSLAVAARQRIAGKGSGGSSFPEHPRRRWEGQWSSTGGRPSGIKTFLFFF